MSTLLTQQVRSAKGNYPWTERRTDTRYHCPRLARVRPPTAPENSGRLSLVRDVSKSGIGLFLTSAVEPGTVLHIELRSRSVVKRVARVVHTSKQEGGWLMGCTLDNPLSDAELQAIGS